MQSDEVKAVRLLRESATAGNQWAQYLLGKFCLQGVHTEKNVPEAENLLTASAEQENSQAGYLLAKLYLTESNTQTDLQKALYWLRKSAKLNNQYAQYQLGKMLLFGSGVEKDIQAALDLLSASAEQGNVYAARMLQNYYSGRMAKPSIGMASLRLLSHLARMFEERIRKNKDDQRTAIDRKLRQKIAEKKQSHGLKMG